MNKANGWCHRGDIELKNRLYDKAIASYELSIKICPNSFAYYGKGKALVQLGRIVEAIDCYYEALRIEPNDEKILYILFDLLFKIGKEEAIDHFKKIPEINPEKINEFNYFNFYVLYKLGKSESMTKWFIKVIEINQENSTVYNYMGYAFHKLGLFQKEIECYQEAIEIFSEDETAWYNMGYAHFKLGLYDNAKYFFNEALKINSNYDYANEGIKECNAKLKEIPEPVDEKENVPNLSTYTHYIKLLYVLDFNSQNEHVLELYTCFDDYREKVIDFSQFSCQFAIEHNNTKYKLSSKDLDTFDFLKILGPIKLDNGTFFFKSNPQVLQRIREQKMVEETLISKKLQIKYDELKPEFAIDYDPKAGFVIDAGYLINKEKIPLKELENTSNNFVLFKDIFYYFDKKSLESKAKKYLEKGRTTIDFSDIPEFFMRDLVLLRNELNAVLTDSARESTKYIDEPLQPSVHVNMNELGWLDFKIDYVVGEDQITEDIFRKSNEEYIRINDRTWIKNDKETRKRTEKYLKELDKKQCKEGFSSPYMQIASLEEFIEKIGGKKEVSEEYQRFLDQITHFKYDDNFILPTEIEESLKSNDIELKGYQRSGIHRLSWWIEHQIHGILADDMGLGKTIQTAITMCMFYQKENISKHSLIICPKSIVPFWKREIQRCSKKKWPWLIKYVGPSRNKKLFEKNDPHIFITTYETATIDIDIIKKYPFYFMVLDEATKIKNPYAKCTDAIKSINAMHRIALSGTPIENRPSELWSIYDFLMKGHLGNLGKFQSQFEIPIQDLDPESANQLWKRIKPFFLRRTKKEVEKDLPEKIEKKELCDLTPRQKSLLREIRENYINPYTGKNYISMLPIIGKLKMVCNHPALFTKINHPLYGQSKKFDLVIKKVQEIHEKEEKVVIFSQYLHSLNLFEIAFNEQGISYVRIDGSTSDDERQNLIDKFNGGQIDVALCSLRACGRGITLTAANHVIHFDLWWNPAVFDQATDRVHRIGQKKTVYVYTFLVQLEEKIADLLERKRKISDLVFDESAVQERNCTKEELLELLRPLV